MNSILIKQPFTSNLRDDIFSRRIKPWVKPWVQPWTLPDEKNDVIGGIVDALFEPLNTSEFGRSFWKNDTTLSVVAPGLSSKDFDISIQNDALIVSVTEEVIKDKQSFASSFKLSIPIDKRVDQAKMTATYTSGILDVTFPQKEQQEQEVRKIKVQ